MLKVNRFDIMQYDSSSGYELCTVLTVNIYFITMCSVNSNVQDIFLTGYSMNCNVYLLTGCSVGTVKYMS
jgi:hypothetical protein